MTDGRLPVGDIAVAYTEQGTGTPVVFVHGLAEDRASWAVQQRELTAVRTVSVDLRGHGDSAIGDADGTLAQLGGDLVGVLEALTGPAVCVGFSLGGTVVLRAALDRPDLVRSAIVLGTSSVVGRAAVEFYGERIALVERGDAAAIRDAMRADTAAALANGDVMRPNAAAAPADRDVVRADAAAAPADRDVVRADAAAAPADRDVMGADAAGVPAIRDAMRADTAAALANGDVVRPNAAAAPADRGVVGADTAAALADRDVVRADAAAGRVDRGVVRADAAGVPADRDVVRADAAAAPADREAVGADAAGGGVADGGLDALVAARVAAIGDGAGYVNAARAMAGLRAQPLTEELANVQCPVAVVGADADSFCPRKAADILVDALPAATYYEIPGAGHLMNVDQPALVTDLLRELLAEGAGT